MLPEEVKRKRKLKNIEEQWIEVCQIYHELKAGKRNIQKAADGKLYAVRV